MTGVLGSRRNGRERRWERTDWGENRVGWYQGHKMVVSKEPSQPQPHSPHPAIHRIVQRLGLEETPKDHQVPTPLSTGRATNLRMHYFQSVLQDPSLKTHPEQYT